MLVCAKSLRGYQKHIAELAPGYNPGQIEAFMRLEYGTLDALSPENFRREVRIACQCIDADADAAIRLAQSYGL